jgi:hypothetical protein
MWNMLLLCFSYTTSQTYVSFHRVMMCITCHNLLPFSTILFFGNQFTISHGYKLIWNRLVAQVIIWLIERKQHWIKYYLTNTIVIRSVVEQMKQYLTRLNGKLQNWWLKWQCEWLNERWYMWSCVQLNEAKYDKVKMWLLEWNNTWLDHIETYKTNHSIDNVIDWIK